jgi:hypothetical protein
MDWLDDVQQRMKRKNKILFTQENPLLHRLGKLLQTQTHRTVVLWALELAAETVTLLKERYPGDERPAQTLMLTRAWAAGEVKMPVAKAAILRVHAMAKEIDSAEDIALCHAIGQACGTVHAPGHAMGYPIYELTALLRRYGIEDCAQPIEARNAHYIERLAYWQAQDDAQYQWAAFLAPK